jgi:hypothetical protein
MKQLLENEAFQLRDSDGCTPEDLARELDDSTALDLLLANSMGHSEASALICSTQGAKVTPRLCVEGPEILVQENRPYN